MSYDKPFKTFDEQIGIISSRNVQIEKDMFTLEALSSISYYTLMNGYKNTFLEVPNGDRFSDGTTFRMIYTAHWIDISISHIILKYVLLIEKSLKTKVAYLVGQNYGVHDKDYLFFKNYSNPNNSRDGVLNDIKGVIRNPRPNSVTEYYKNEKNHIPPWIIVNDLMFGLAFRWYTILRPELKEEICETFFREPNSNVSVAEKKEFLRKSLCSVRSFRNKVAHGNRTFELELDEELPKSQLLKLAPPKLINQIDYSNGIGNKDLYSVILCVEILLNDPFQIENFREELRSQISPYVLNKSDFNGKNILQLLHLPEDYLSRIE